jgi:hypothetical protein
VLLIAAGAALVAALAVVLLTKGGSSSPSSAGESSSSGAAAQTPTASHRKKSTKGAAKSAKATPPAEISLVVLNGTTTTGLATRVSTQLQQGGYSQAAPKFGQPPGAHEATVVEYAGGHQAEATQVAHSLAVSHVQPMEQAVSALAGSAKVVVVVGVDKASP